MLKKTITYTDFNGDEVTEDHYFHLSKADLIEMEMVHKGGMAEYLQAIVASEDGKAIMKEFKELILAGYGKKSEDGKRFIKTQALRDEFLSSEAYSELFMELCTDADKAADFVNGVIPAGLERDMAKITAEPNEMPNRVQDLPPRILTTAEIEEMDPRDLRSGLATGRYKLAPS